MPTWTENKEERLYLIQIDLANHSKWVAELDSNPDATSARAELAENLRGRLTPFGFSIAFWAGDGGVFGSPHSTKSEDVIEAIDIVFIEFERWQKTSVNKSDKRDLLSIRVTVDLQNIFTHDNPGYWYSDTYNKFLKYERVIAANGTATITENVFKNLRAGQQLRWREGKTSKFLAGDESWILYRDSKRKIKHTQTFVEWLVDSKYSTPGNRSAKLKNLGAITCCDETVIITKPLVQNGFGNIVVEEAKDISNDEWVMQEKELKITEGKSFFKAAPIKITDPLTDNDVLTIKYGTCKYHFVSAFHRNIEEKFEEWTRIVDGITDLVNSSKVIPRILVTHNLVIFENQTTKKPEIIIGQRSPKAGQLFYYNAAWSVSFEEQFRPVNIDEFKEMKDVSLMGCMERGFREEIAPDLEVTEKQIHALFVESRNLNIAALGLIRCKGTEDQLRQNVSKAKDFAETKIIVGIPLDDKNMNLLLNSHANIPLELLDSATFYKGSVAAVDFDQLKWHPTSFLRLTLAKWLLSK